MAAYHSESDIPQWKKHLIARLRQNKCISNGNSVVTVSTGRQLSPLFHDNSSGRVPKLYKQTSTEIPSSTPSSTCNQLSATTSAAELATTSSFSGRNGTSVLSENRFCPPLTHRKIKSKMVQERTWTVDYASCESVDTVSENDNYSRTSDSESSEELHYGPGIVNKLRNKYLSLALRRENYNRPSILNLRKATSLENMLDDDDDVSAKESEQFRIFQTNGTDKNSSNRYRNVRRGAQDMKRARSVEAISRFENMISPPPRAENMRPKSLHEYILISDKQEGNDKSYRKPKDSKVVEIETNIENSLFSDNYVPRINRPKRITPVMNEREKPPADVVKQAKMIFERRPEQRTKPPVNTGEVAAKVASYKNIIVQSKPVKKPPIKIKPPSGTPIEKTVTNGKTRQAQHFKKEVEDKKIREIKNESEIIGKNVNVSQVDAPKVTPRIKARHIEEMSTQKKNVIEEKIINEEEVEPVKETEKEEVVEGNKSKAVQLPSPVPDISIIEFTKFENDVAGRLCETPDLIMTASPMPVSTPSCDKIETEEDSPYRATSPTSWRKSDEPRESKNSESVTPNYCDSNRERSPVIETSSNENVPFNEPLKLIINGNQSRGSPSPESSPRISQISSFSPLSRRKIVSPPIRLQKDSPLFDRVIEKNLINVAKSLEQSKPVASVRTGKTEEKIDVIVPKRVRRPPREPESNSIVFKFTDRKDAPDYIQNDRSRTAARLEKPKVGEGGIILLPGATFDESFTDEDEEIMKYLQAPPSPCDVAFINDNILIDGKSSISQKTKKGRMRISFVEAGPDVYEYPSESSLLVDEIPSPASTTPATPLAGHTVPTLSGSSLANYTPKSTEEFQPGITRSTPNVPASDPSQDKQDLPEDAEHQLLEEIHLPIMFSSGTNSDMLF